MKNTSSLTISDENKAKAALKRIDWSFKVRKRATNSNIRPFDVRKYHWYPATFIPEIPFSLIEILTKPRARVFDPFSGIGTSYFQALSLGRRPVATDICEVAINFIEDLSTLFDPNIDFKELEKKMKELIDNYDKNGSYPNKVPEDVLIEKLKPWFHKKDFNQLSYLIIKKRECDDRIKQATMRIVLSSMLKPLSSQDRDWGCIADNVIPSEEQRSKYKNSLQQFKQKVFALLGDISSHVNNLGSTYENFYNDEIRNDKKAYQMDVRKDIPVDPKSIDLVVTSPPYPEMTDYVASQRLSYYLLGEEVGLSSSNKDMNQEIGSRRKRGRRSSLLDYLDEMQQANKSIVESVKPGGVLCYILPVLQEDEKPHKKSVIKKMVESIKSKKNISELISFDRSLPSTQRAHNFKWSTVGEEKIIIFRKE